MAFDGITVAALVTEFNKYFINGRIFKIAQPEKDELFLTIKNNKEQYKLQISAGATLPLMYITNKSKQSPLTAPNFCMLLRKHINNGRIISVTQPELERIIDFEIEHLNELGDVCRKHLIIELMGKHSNIIFTDDNNKIIDSIKHISALTSSVREVLPGREYFIPQTTEKSNPLTIDKDTFIDKIFTDSTPIYKSLYLNLTGLSPVISNEICYYSGIDADLPANCLDGNSRIHLYNMFEQLIDKVKTKQFAPTIYYDNNTPIEFNAFPLEMFATKSYKTFSSISEILETYYAQKETITRIRQRSADLRQIVQTALNKNYKKYDLQLKQLKDTEKRDKYKLYGELLTAYAYSIENGLSEITVNNYYDNSELTIPLNSELSAMDNAKKYYEKYNKLKRTYDALTDIIKTTQEEIEHLESISIALDINPDENALKELKEELTQYGYIKRKITDKKAKFTSKPMHFRSKDGFDIFVGKNNFQNEDLTFKVATGNDWWFHAKGIPGSHVIVKCDGKELPDSVFEEAGRLAAYFSKSRGLEKVEVDYVQKKHVKKVNGGKPGFVIYHTNFSMLINPDISNIEQIS
ncbi:MAG: fibronectin/fibrinogen-binding protein [Lachnospiraceae bacterium]|nr:fibronectin/fibrinogen-binding protein [Lachnospiraceae bacterium]MBQ4068577.1 NFACT family protein [Lachnospiraceae bacterium]